MLLFTPSNLWNVFIKTLWCTSMYKVNVTCRHSSAIVTSSCIHDNVLIEEDPVDWKLVPSIHIGIISAQHMFYLSLRDDRGRVEIIHFGARSHVPPYICVQTVAISCILPMWVRQSKKAPSFTFFMAHNNARYGKKAGRSVLVYGVFMKKIMPAHFEPRLCSKEVKYDI